MNQTTRNSTISNSTIASPKTAVHSNNNPNNRTLDSYSRHVNEYVAMTSDRIDDYSPEMIEWINAALSLLPPGARVLEIGSAILRDSTYMRQQGFDTTCSDGAPGFVQRLRELGEPALHLNVVDDPIPTGYRMIYANGVFPHLSPAEAELVLKKMHAALEPGDVVAFSIKIGEGELLNAEKFDAFCYTYFWSEPDLLSLLARIGFKLTMTNRNKGAFPSHNWFNLVTQKT